MKTFVVNGTTYQHFVVLIKRDNSQWGRVMDYLYDTKLHWHAFVSIDQLAEFARTGDLNTVFNNDYSHLFDGQN